MNRFSTALMLALTLAQGSLALAQVTPPREVPRPPAIGQRPVAPSRTFPLTNLPPRRFATNAAIGTARAGAAAGQITVPPGLTNSDPRTTAAPTGFTGTNLRRLPPMGTNLLPSNLPGTNVTGTNIVSANAVAVSGSTNVQRTARPITPAQRAQIARLTADLTAMRLAAQITPAQREQLLNTLRASALGPRKPSDAALTQFVNNLLLVWPTRGFTVQQKAQLAIDFNRILNSGELSPAETQLVINDARRIFQASGMSLQAVEMLSKDLLSIAAQVQGGPPPEPQADAVAAPAAPR